MKLISEWKPSWNVEEEKLLVESGRKELREMGKRFRGRMKGIFQPEDKAGAVYTVSA